MKGRMTIAIEPELQEALERRRLQIEARTGLDVSMSQMISAAVKQYVGDGVTYKQEYGSGVKFILECLLESPLSVPAIRQLWEKAGRSNPEAQVHILTKRLEKQEMIRLHSLDGRTKTFAITDGGQQRLCR